MMGIWVVYLLNKKWEEDLTATLNYITGCDWWNALQNESAKDKLLRRLSINWIYKTIALFIEVRFFDGKVKVAIITFLANFKFSIGIFINHFSANTLQTKERQWSKFHVRKVFPWL